MVLVACCDKKVFLKSFSAVNLVVGLVHVVGCWTGVSGLDVVEVVVVVVPLQGAALWLPPPRIQGNCATAFVSLFSPSVQFSVKK